MNEVFLDLEIFEKEPKGFSLSAEAVGCYIEIDGKLLLLQYSTEKVHVGKWDVPGGKLEENETPQEGAIRELFEETGIVLDQSSKVQHVLSLYIRGKLDYIYHQFKIQLDQIPPVHLSSEHLNFIWASGQDLKKLPLVERADDVLQFYRTALTNKRGAASVNAYLILRKDDQILFHLRKNTGYCDGMWSLVAGHVEAGESATVAMIREAREEIGLDLSPSQIKAVHVMHRKSDRDNVDIFFDCPSWEGSVSNREPEKCAQLEFCPLDALPSPLIDYITTALKCIANEEPYSEQGWPP